MVQICAGREFHLDGTQDPTHISQQAHTKPFSQLYARNLPGPSQLGLNRGLLIKHSFIAPGLAQACTKHAPVSAASAPSDIYRKNIFVLWRNLDRLLEIASALNHIRLV